MQPQSLGYRTDLIFPKFDGNITDRGDYLVILTPSNPTFHWGNFLLFPHPPGQGDFERWKTSFAREFNTHPQVTHIALGWDTTDGKIGETQPFLDEGFSLMKSVVLTTQQVQKPPKYNSEVVVRPLAEDWEWDKALENQIRCRPLEYGLEGYRAFKQGQMGRYREMAQAGIGAWFGAFLDNQLMADLGLFFEKTVGRFQQVETHPDFRRRGICGSLVYQVSRYGFEQMGLKTLVMVADEDYHAAKIYESVGFQPKEHQGGVAWWPKSE